MAVPFLGGELVASELPRLPKDPDSGKHTYQEQKQLPDLPEAYVSTSPEDLREGLQVGTLDVPGTEEAVKALIDDDVDFMSDIDRSKIKPGVDTITLRDALHMKSGLSFAQEHFAWELGDKYRKQRFFQKLFEATEPVTPQSKQYKYTGTDPSMIMMILDIKANGKVQDFIAKELAGRTGAAYCWDNQGCGIPKCGAGSNFTSRDLVKLGTAIIQGGKYGSQQLLSAEYVEKIMASKKKDGYYYCFHNRTKSVGNKRVRFISGIGAGGQYMATFPELNVVAIATSHIRTVCGSSLLLSQLDVIPRLCITRLRAAVDFPPARWRDAHNCPNSPEWRTTKPRELDCGRCGMVGSWGHTYDQQWSVDVSDTRRQEGTRCD